MGRTVIAPVRAQHLQALEQANEVRLARAELKRNVASADVSAAEVVQRRPWETETMAISELLMSQRRWGRARARRLLLSLQLPENKHLGTLTDRQRASLSAALGERGGGSAASLR